MLLEAAEGVVSVEYRQFVLQDVDDSRNSALALTAPPGRRWLAIGGPGGVRLHSAGNDHSASVRLEAHDAEPPADTESWDEVADVDFHVEGTALRLLSVTAEPGAGPVMSAVPGRHRMRAHVAGTAAAEALGDASFEVGVERWLLQVWPTG